MKKIRLSVSGFLLAALAASASPSDFGEAASQTSRWSFGLGGGVNLSSLHFSELNKDIFPENKSNTSGLFSVYVERVFGKHGSFGVRPQFTFLTRGGHLTNIYRDAVVLADDDETLLDMYEYYGISDVRYGLKATYFDIRVPLTYYIGTEDWRVRPYVYVAPIIGFANSGYINVMADMTDGSCAGVHYDLTKANMSTFLFAGAAGIGARYYFPVNGTLCNIGLDVNYQYGFTDTYGKEKDGGLENVVKLVADAGNKPEGSRRFSGFEIAATVGIPFNVFTPKEKKPQIVYIEKEVTPAPTPAPAPAAVVEDKDCYSLDEVAALMSEGAEVRGKTICAIDDNINFDFGKSDIKPSSYDYLDKLAMVLKRTNARIIVKGHTDNVGQPEANLELSRRRALAVMKYLESRGVPASLLSHEAYGMTMPLTSNDTEEGRRMNRRVEFEIR